MVHSSAAVSFPGMALNEAAARGIVERLVMQTLHEKLNHQVFDVLERQGGTPN
ncbi:hypothetical protein KIN20_030649 [Parelaphostrongylus tenuis]|uniref:Uncharacterized protein n=1 Tax=Parelaphostrongylus tenuis TaxID=148309 RepID=A0AAD5R4F7_PARTN|nr:hypothetical protein KIN20_030649 [Parelaphostrongylus tenuis]